MILVDKPFVSEFFKQTVRENRLSIVNTKAAQELGLDGGLNLVKEEDAIRDVRSAKDTRIYTTSENAIGWIAQNLSFTDLPDKISLFKDKVRFRRLIKPLYPNFYFQELSMDELDSFVVEDVPMPFIIKPAVGFFSMGVHKVATPQEWEQTKTSIKFELNAMSGLYPREVIDTASFIIEECIDGEEFAMDAYFDAAGNPVVVGIYKHIFSSDADVSDRIYITSKKIIEDNLAQFSYFLNQIGNLAKLKNFPMHVEIRRDRTESILPIEINPMRFGGWCTTADMTHLAYGFNPYVSYFSQKSPKWGEILTGKEGKLYSIVILDNSTGIDGDQIVAFDYDLLLSQFENPLDLRKIDYRDYPVFGFLFTETSEGNFSELERILKSDLREFVSS